MHARVATFDSDPAGIDQMVDGIRKEIESGNVQPGLEDAKGVMIFVDREHGKTLGIMLFDSEDALKRGDEALNSMSPDGPSNRTSVQFYEVPIQTLS
jgi:hypothetical protein